ncbi:MAG: hypothetical protein F4227_10690 [Gammaproteobacteria bacterium]|nr:hypothetical protein [Gammaproteobacteria bacterium]MYF03400.1 hypothetical protein [Gammaproteobacteria bacterium]MYI77084.1 hypothetical protein [Gammaproteobacteria bacterium]
MKSLLATFILPLIVFLAFGINADEEEVAEPESESEAPIEESEDENTESDTEEETAEPEVSEETKPVAEAETEETEKVVPPPPTTPWKRLPVTTKIPVNYDIGLPQDI